MITPMTLQDSLNGFIEERVASKYRLKTGGDGSQLKNPKVIRSGILLPKSIDSYESESEIFPYILTRIDKIENVKGSRDSIITMLIIFGVYDPGTYDEERKRIDDGSGYRDFWNLVETTRQALFSQVILDRKYPIVEDFFEAEMFLEQEYPYFEGYCATKWNVMLSLPHLNFDERGESLYDGRGLT